MKKIKNFAFSRLVKLELPDLAESVIKKMDDYDPELLKIKEAFDLLAEMQPQINLLRLSYGPHEITKELHVLRKKRQTFASLITYQTKALSKDEMEEAYEAIKLVRGAVNIHLKNLGRKGDRIIHQNLLEFFRKIEESAELEAAFESLGFTNYLDELQSVHSTIEELWSARKISINQRPDVYLPPISKSVREALRNFFFQINLAQKRNVELDYSQLVVDMNAELNVFRGVIGMREAINKKKAEEAIDGEGEVDNDGIIEEDADESDDPIETTQFAGRMMHMNAETVNVNGNGFENGELDEKKTAAQSTKQLQLPIIEERGTNM